MIAGPLLPLIALAAPLAIGALAALPMMRERAIRLLPLAPLGGLACAFLSPLDAVTQAPDMLLGATLGLDASSALFLGFSSFLWLMAGLFAQAYMRDTRKPAVFTGFWCLTLAGNLGVFLARDVATFYVSFAAVSLASYILVVHEGTERALRAGRVYITLAVLGEACLLVGFMIGADAAESLLITDIRAAIAGSPLRDPALALLIVGFGVKAGLMPLHVWLPLAHPAAPTPASAVLSGAIVKAGIFGLMVFMPVDGTIAATGVGLTAAGLATAYLGVFLGLAQANPKAVLAYSTISQMGLVSAAIGAAMTSENPAPALLAASLYAAHHGLAKGALFLSVGVVAATGRRFLPLVLAAIALMALSVAGLPLTGGGLAKTALKGQLDDALIETIVALSATGTALLLARYLFVVAGQCSSDAAERPAALLLAPFIATAGAALILPWILLPGFGGIVRGYAFAPGTLWTGFWPLALALAITGLAIALKLRAPRIPEGDIVVPLEHAAQAAVSGIRRGAERLRDAPGIDIDRLLSGLDGLERVEARLARWSVSGLLLIGLVLAIALALRG